MATVPVIRSKLGNISSKNKSLQDIFKTMKQGLEILEVKPHTQGIHNTAITVRVDLGEGLPDRDRYKKRIHFYNRLDLAVVLAGVTWSATTIPEIIKELNLKGYDFNSDDLELSSGNLKAKETSLGYYGQTGSAPEPEECYCVLDHQSLNGLPWDQNLLTDISFPGSDATYPVDRVVASFMVNGEEYTKTFTSTELQGITTHRQLLNASKSIFANSLNIQNTEIAGGGSYPIFENLLTDKCNSFSLNLDYYNGSNNLPQAIKLIPLFELCPKGQQKIVCAGLSRIASLNTSFFLLTQMVEGEFTIIVNGNITKYPISQGYQDSLSGILDAALNHTEWRYDPYMVYYNGENVMENLTLDCLEFTLKFKATGEEETTILHTIIGTSVNDEPVQTEIWMPLGFLPVQN